jgi:hypothetical protein
VVIRTIAFGDADRSVVPKRNTCLNEAASGIASTLAIFTMMFPGWSKRERADRAADLVIP